MSDYKPSPQDYQDLFETNRVGNSIFEDLNARFTRPAVTKGGIDAVLETYKRLGAREVLEHIVIQINRANGIHTNEEGEESHE